MRAVIIERYGPPDVLRLVETSVPQVRPNEVLVKVCAAAVNPLDWRIRNGSLRFVKPVRFPKILGFETSGVVQATGAGVRTLKAGDEVFCLHPRAGGYAEYVLAKEELAIRKPANVPLEALAAVPIGACTSLQALRDLGHIAAGDEVLINGAAGGVGMFAVQLGKLFGARVTGVCSTRNVPFVRDLGADDVIDYTQDDFTQSGARYHFDIIFDAAAKSSYRACRPLLKRDGNYIDCLPSPSSLFFQAWTSLTRTRRCRNILMKVRSADLEYLSRLLEAGDLRIAAYDVLPIEDVAKAHELSELGHVRGKLVLRVATL
jgi:NADPH:quinone reductase-like Zn-dependent oxidoreductase